MSIVVICAISLLNNSETFAQNSSEKGSPVAASNQSQIVLQKLLQVIPLSQIIQSL